MYLHIGGEYLLKKKNILGIFDLETTTISKITKEYLKDKQTNHEIITVNDELPKSFIIYIRNESIYIYITSISTITLYKRAKESI